ncbi:MAG: hypothetical protein FJX54_20145, partial [Alphaproteobacteria bacterium]|nr:hypothetical protein [Alphaproteobacteria bacterium]
MSTATSNERFWPATFAERGATVPFTTPALAAARLRSMDPEKVEFLVPGLSGGKGTYVIPAKAVMEMFKLTVHDRALLEELDRKSATSPHDIRIATLTVASTGLAGGEAAMAAKTILSAAENQELVTRLFVVVRALEQLSPNPTKISVTDMITEAGKKRARADLAAAGERLDIPLEELLDRLEIWGNMVAPLGVARSAAIGPMRRVWQQQMVLARAMRDWAAGDWADDAQPDATLIADVAEETNRVATGPITELDGALDNIAKYIVPWDETERQLKAAMDKLGWFFDGWDQLLKVWDAAQREAHWSCPESFAHLIRRRLRIVGPAADRVAACSCSTWLT